MKMIDARYLFKNQSWLSGICIAILTISWAPVHSANPDVEKYFVANSGIQLAQNGPFNPTQDYFSLLTEGSQGVAKRLAKRTGLDLNEISSLRVNEVGWGDVNTAATIAVMTSRPLFEVVSFWQKAGHRWQSVADHYRLGNIEKLMDKSKEGLD
jgi:hypothetical protein